MEIEQKYLSLLEKVQRRQLPNLENIQPCFQALLLALAMASAYALLLASYARFKGRFVLLFLLDANTGGLVPNPLAEKAGVARATAMGPLLDGLEHELLIGRQNGVSDCRALCVQLMIALASR